MPGLNCLTSTCQKEISLFKLPTLKDEFHKKWEGRYAEYDNKR